MAFQKREWKDRLVEFPARRQLTTEGTGVSSIVTVSRSEGTIMEEGDAWNAANMNDLEERIAQGIRTSIGSVVYVTTVDETLEGKVVTLTDDVNTETATIENGKCTFTGVLMSGDVKLSTTNDDGEVASTTIQISGYASYYATLHTAKKFAFHYSENNSASSSVTYPAGYDNYGWSPMYVDLSNGKPVYNSWDPTKDEVRWLFPRSCMLKYDGTVDYYLNENDETKKEDGTASDVANTSYAGNAMVEWGQDGKKIYWQLIPDDDGKGFTFAVTNKPLEGFDPWNHYNCNGGISDHFYTPKYFGGHDGTRLRSISGMANYVNQTATVGLQKAKANNLTSDEIWNMETYVDWFFIWMLAILMGKDMNVQSKFGTGRCASGNNAAIGIGTMDGKGRFYGSSDQTSGVKLFGMENPYGNLWRRIAGLINDKGTVKIKLTYGTEDGSTVRGYNLDGSGYITHGTIGGGTSEGYVSHANITNRGVTPNTMSGSATTYYCDGGWFTNSQVNYALVGGGWNSGLLVGLGGVALNAAASAAASRTGAALSCKPV